LGNSGLIAGAFSSTSGKADTVLDTNGQILYYNNGRKALDKEDNDDVLTLKSGLPSWEAAASAGANTALSNLSSVAVNAAIDMNSNDLDNIGFIDTANPVELTISSGAVTFTQSYHSIDTEADASTDNLDGFDGLGIGQIVIIRSNNNARDPTFRSATTGETKMIGNGNFTCADTDAMFMFIADTKTSNFTAYQLTSSVNAG
jgi:hypothetical protein